MRRTLLKSKLHCATVTGADLNYEGSIAIDPELCQEADLFKNEKVEIYNCNNGARFSTYVIFGKAQEISLNGAAARLVAPGDTVIICSYADYDSQECMKHQARILLMNSDNSIKDRISSPTH